MSVYLEEISNTIEVCFLDFDGTLYPSNVGIEKQIKSCFRDCAMERLDVNEIKVKKILHEYRKEFRSSILGLEKYHNIDPDNFYKDLYGRLDMSLLKPKPGIDEVLNKLSDKLPLYVFSNSYSTFVNNGLDYLGLDKYITGTITVDDNNFIRKPNKEVYISAIERTGTNAENICMFDDIPSSLETAKEVGIITILVGNGLRDDGFVDLHTKKEYAKAPDYCDYSTMHISDFIMSNML